MFGPLLTQGLHLCEVIYQILANLSVFITYCKCVESMQWCY